jgi:hypothetical protein
MAAGLVRTALQRPVKADIGREAVALVDATDLPLTAEHAVIDVVLVGVMTKTGWDFSMPRA